MIYLFTSNDIIAGNYTENIEDNCHNQGVANNLTPQSLSEKYSRLGNICINIRGQIGSQNLPLGIFKSL